jgi:site-specific DNA-methyltransferase (adenine-specific)
MAKVTLYNGDCIEVMKNLVNEGVKVDAVITDPPFGTTASTWDSIVPFDKMWECINKLLAKGGSTLLFANGSFTPMVMLSNIEDYKYKYAWIKNNSTNFVHAKNRPLTKHEDILVFSPYPMGHKSLLKERRMVYNPQGLVACNKVIKAGKGRFGTVAGVRPSHKEEFTREFTNYPTDVLNDFPEVPAGKKVHTNQKPVELLEFLVKTYTNEGGIVLDFTAGSGSTGVACVNTGRGFIGIELDKTYYDIMKSRIGEAIKIKRSITNE